MRIVEWVKVRRSKLQGPECPWCEEIPLEACPSCSSNPKGLHCPNCFRSLICPVHRQYWWV